MPLPPFAGLLLRLSSDAGVGLGPGGAPRRVRLAGVTFELEPLFGAAAGGPGVATSGDSPRWVVARAEAAALAGANPWDLIHDALAPGGLAAAGLAADHAEPDFAQEWLYLSGDECRFDDQDTRDGRVPAGPGFAWHLRDDYAGLRAAREAAGEPADGRRVRIAHLDTGYSPGHAALARHLRADLGRNFTGDGPDTDARDPDRRGFAKNPGHGTGTLGILAGGRIRVTQGGYAFDADLGGAPHAEVVPVRVAKGVVQLYTSSLARGIDYAASLAGAEDTRIHVLSMSLGGLPSQAWADAVNRAYDAGVVTVAAAGNHFSAGFLGAPARSIVYPARFRRVVAACGVMADLSPYYGLPFGAMQGNWGPASKMGTAMAACTPNIPWAELGCDALVDMNGSGTSAATPQIAAAAALYIQRHRAAIEAYPEAWMRVEAVRQALFVSADPLAGGMHARMVGNGLLRARLALDQPPPPAAALVKTPRDAARFGLMKVLFGWLGAGLAAGAPASGARLALEASQVFLHGDGLDRPNPFEAVVADPDADEIPVAGQRRILELLAERPEDGVSRALREAARRVLRDRVAAPHVVVPAAVEPAPRAFTPPAPPFRALRAFAVDPSLSGRLDTAPVSVVTIRVPWEAGLAPGPAGEYLEVVDHDPASRCFYEPVDLDRREILAQDGLPPSEGTPQFHQQMVYAVAMTTIRHFERALGRPALWRPGPPPPDADPRDDSHYVPRLRIHPHALREPNAYYSPRKVALLFGYYAASGDDAGGHVPGSTVFTCLSHDIVAHETAHALLDGMHRRYLHASNPDVRAFHEAFADLVALFQHFTYPEILRHQISRTRGEIRSQENILGQLAGEFGRTTGRRGALRDAIGRFDPAAGGWVRHEPDPLELGRTIEPHDRGAILVAAVFDAFLAIYERRTRDLVRLATGGSGILQPGAIHPDLVSRLANEAAKAADHVLTMSIRALDYCPPVDITFGEFLRALITADADVLDDDDLGYRVAFIEAFRRRGIHPQGVRSLSEASLRWRPAAHDEHQPSPRLGAGLGRLAGYAREQPFNPGRQEAFYRAREMRREIHRWLRDHFGSGAAGAQDAAFLGLDPGVVDPGTGRLAFEVHALRLAWREGPDGGVTPQVLLTLLQEKQVPLDPGHEGGPPMTLQGGCTVVGDLRSQQVRYAIRKRLDSVSRLARQREFAGRAAGSIAATYAGATRVDEDEGGPDAEPFALIHRGG